LSQSATTTHWDVFISHASEDKESFVRPLAMALCQLGASVWYDEFTLRLGDSISRSIDKGLANSKYGLVVLSNAFLQKRWPEYELRGLVSREMSEDKVILPIWHGVTREQVIAFSPPLADKLAIVTTGMTPPDIAIQIIKVVRLDIYQSHPRSQLERMVTGEALRGLEREIARVRAELETTRNEQSQFKCPFCSAPVIEQIYKGSVDLEPDDGLHERFACGFKSIDGLVDRLCPADPQFPKLQEFHLEFLENAKEPLWMCYAKPKTRMAGLLRLSPVHGRTREEARDKLLEEYQRVSTPWRP
jgi:TIR domain